MRFDLRIQKPFTRFALSLNKADRAQLMRCVEALRLDPYIDNITKFTYPCPPTVFSLYQDGPFCIVYRISGNSLVELFVASHAPYVPKVHEWHDWMKDRE